MGWILWVLAAIGAVTVLVVLVAAVAMYWEWDSQRDYDKIFRKDKKP